MESTTAFWQWDIGVLLSIVGVLFALPTVYAAFKAKSAAEAAESATKDAVAAIAAETTFADLAQLGQLTQEIQTALRGGQWETALIRCGESIRSLVRLRSRPTFASPERLTRVQTLVVSQRKLEGLLERKVADASTLVAVGKANQGLSQLAVELATWLEESKITSGAAT
jgi:hypothetical protein